MAHGLQPGIPWGLTYDEDMVTAELQTGIDSNISEGADAAVRPSNNIYAYMHKALGDPVDELVCDASQPAHQADVEYLHLANTVCNAYHVEHKSP